MITRPLTPGTAITGALAAAFVVATLPAVGAAQRADAAAPVAQQSAFVIPAWAYPIVPAPPAGATTPAPDSVTPLHVPGSARGYTAAWLADFNRVADWFPNDHPSMPEIVAHGRKPAILACGTCHLPDGQGRPENATLAGLTEAYIREQLADFKAGRRHGLIDAYAPIPGMVRIASNLTDDEAAAAAAYFSKLRLRPHARVIESATAPKTHVVNWIRMADADGAREPLGTRIVEVPASEERHERRDTRLTYYAYVPPGSIARGRAIALPARDSVTQPCMRCHGPDLRGVGVVPPLAGRSPSYIVRQLVAFRTGARSSDAAAPMRAEVAPLSIEQMIAVAAYAGSLRP